MKTKALLLVGLIVLTIAFSSCKKKNDQPAPDLPPQESFVMDMTFKDGDTTKVFGLKDIQGTYRNWWHSAVNVVVWNTVLTFHMIVPVAAYLESFNHEAVYDVNDETWTWSYNFYAAGALHTAELVAAENGQNIHWEMFISKSGAFSDVLWFYGDSKMDGTEGTWTIKKDALNPVEYIGIEWHRTSDVIGDIKYTNVESGASGYGDYIMYGLTSDYYNAFYDIEFNDNLTKINFNQTTEEGRVSDFNKFGDNAWHCWDSTLMDVSCN